MSWEIMTGDVRELPLENESVTAVVCDPPYELGFMGKDWDRGGVSYDPDTWRGVKRVLKPGGMLFAFGGTRTFHRITVAIEDAGFEIRDCMMWLYGKGLPKSFDISKGIDALDAPEARRWAGRGTALKPAWEPIIVAMKPLRGTFACNALRHGVAGLNIDGARVGTEEMAVEKSTGEVVGRNQSMAAPLTRTEQVGVAAGRWPSNVVLDEEAAAVLDEQSGESTSTKWSTPGTPTGVTMFGQQTAGPSYDDSGGASRFFYTTKASREERNAGIPHGETNDHPTVKPIDLMRYLVCLVKMPENTVILDPFCGSGSTGCAAVLEGVDFVGVDLDPHNAEIARKRVEHFAKYGDQEDAVNMSRRVRNAKVRAGSLSAVLHPGGDK